MTIEVAAGGPYLIPEGTALHRARPVSTEQGEPIAWEHDTSIAPEGGYALCRCGASSNKPFCDGSHNSHEWDGTETAATTTYDERSTVLPGTGLTLRDDRGLCQNAGFCANKISNVWKMIADTDSTPVRSQVAAMVERCPSGALTYRLDGADGDVEPDLAPGVTVVDDGALWVTGGLGVTRSDGKPLETRNRMTLCRCGASSTKPLCDGSHAKVGFKDS